MPSRKPGCDTCELPLCQRHWFSAHCCLCGHQHRKKDHTLFFSCMTCHMGFCRTGCGEMDGFVKKSWRPEDEKRCKNCFDASPDGFLARVKAFVLSDTLLRDCGRHSPPRNWADDYEVKMTCRLCNCSEPSKMRYTSVFYFSPFYLIPQFTAQRSTYQLDIHRRIWLNFTCTACFARLVAFIIQLNHRPRTRSIACDIFPRELLELIGQYAFEFKTRCSACLD